MDGLTKSDMDKLRHMLGATEFRAKKDWGFRNHYCTSAILDDSMERLVKLGYVTRGRIQSNGSAFFHATKEGCKAAGLGPKAIKRAMEDM